MIDLQLYGVFFGLSLIERNAFGGVFFVLSLLFTTKYESREKGTAIRDPSWVGRPFTNPTTLFFPDRRLFYKNDNVQQDRSKTETKWSKLTSLKGLPSTRWASLCELVVDSLFAGHDVCHFFTFPFDVVEVFSDFLKLNSGFFLRYCMFTWTTRSKGNRFLNSRRLRRIIYSHSFFVSSSLRICQQQLQL